jgi:hypothetical protein
MKKAFWIVALLLIVSIVANVWMMTRQPDVETVVERDTIWRDTTIYTPTPVDSHLTGRVVYVKVPMPGKRDTLRDTIRDSIEVQIPIMQKRYDDNLYTAWVSGFHPNLDSIRLHQREIVTTVTKYVEKPAKRLAIGPSIGVGYGFINGKPDIFAGVTVTWNFNK